MKLVMKCLRCHTRGKVWNKKTLGWDTCPTCKGEGKALRKVSYAGPVGRAMLAQERSELAEIRHANKAGRLGGTTAFQTQERLRQKGKITFIQPARSLIGGWMLSDWRKPLERSYGGDYGTKLWSPVSKKLVHRKKA